MGLMARVLAFAAPKPKDGGGHESESMELVAWRMGLIAPNGKRKEQWDWFVLALVLYTGVQVPFTLSFYAFNDWAVSPVGFIFDILVDICYIADIFISWRTTYYNREGLLVVDKKLAREKYLKTWFTIDFVASVPFRHIFFIAYLGQTVQAPAGVRLPSLLKLSRVFRLGKKIDRLSSSKMFRIFQFTCTLLYACHCYACIWYWQGNSAAPLDGEVIELPGINGTSWVYRYELSNEDLQMKYTTALYWAITTMMKSPWFHPASPGEFGSAIIMIIFGCVLFAYFIGNVTAVITAANAAGGRYRGQISELKLFCVSHGVGAKLTSKLLAYQDAVWTETFGGQNRQQMVNSLPSHLQLPVTVDMYHQILDALPFLFDCTSAGGVSFLNALKVQVCDRSDMLLRAGALATTMYVLNRGEIKIDVDLDALKETIEDHVPGGRVGGSKKPKKMKKSAKDAIRGRTDKMGTLLGFQNPFKTIVQLDYSVTAITRCSLLSITRSQLKEVLTQFPQDQEVFMKQIEHAHQTNLGSTGGPKGRETNASRVSMGPGNAPSAKEFAEFSTMSTSSTHATLAEITKEAREIEESEKREEDAIMEQGAASIPEAEAVGTEGVKVMASTQSVNELRRKVDTLTKIVTAQYQMMEQQSHAIAQLSHHLKMKPGSNAGSVPSPMQNNNPQDSDGRASAIFENSTNRSNAGGESVAVLLT
jgi:CRP-like cAMP-binding protein